MLTLEVARLGKSYGSVLAVADVSFTVRGGSCFALLGPNGAGKSTVLHVLAGLTGADTGDVQLTDRGVDSGSQKQLSDAIGFAPDDLPMPDLLSGIEYLELVAGLRKMTIEHRHLSVLAESVRLESALHRLIGDYSHGMRRKLALLGAIMHSPDVLILDEPMRGLDPESTAVVKEIIRRYIERGKIVLLSTHDMLVADQLADRILILDRGRPAASGSSEEICRSANRATLEESFLAVTGIEQDVARMSNVLLQSLESAQQQRVGAHDA